MKNFPVIIIILKVLKPYCNTTKTLVVRHFPGSHFSSFGKLKGYIYYVEVNNLL